MANAEFLSRALFRAASISGRGCVKERLCNPLAPDVLSDRRDGSRGRPALSMLVARFGNSSSTSVVRSRVVSWRQTSTPFPRELEILLYTVRPHLESEPVGRQRVFGSVRGRATVCDLDRCDPLNLPAGYTRPYGWPTPRSGDGCDLFVRGRLCALPGTAGRAGAAHFD